MAKVLNINTDIEETINVGDWISFKCDVEQRAQIHEIADTIIWFKAPDDGFSGDYVKDSKYCHEFASNCWIE